jgi:transcriptional regulator GlxA family with amidase domain
VLAATGLLDGLRATSNKRVFHFAEAMGPRVHWQRRARWVHDGRYWTSSGVTAGMDMALAIIAQLCGRDVALETASGAEYLWRETPGDDPFALELA